VNLSLFKLIYYYKFDIKDDDGGVVVVDDDDKNI
jgi:hypothetical protein